MVLSLTSREKKSLNIVTVEDNKLRKQGNFLVIASIVIVIVVFPIRKLLKLSDIIRKFPLKCKFASRMTWQKLAKTRLSNFIT